VQVETKNPHKIKPTEEKRTDKRTKRKGRCDCFLYFLLWWWAAVGSHFLFLALVLPLNPPSPSSLHSFIHSFFPKPQEETPQRRIHLSPLVAQRLEQGTDGRGDRDALGAPLFGGHRRPPSKSRHGGAEFFQLGCAEVSVVVVF
jgi:hypothetical protein